MKRLILGLGLVALAAVSTACSGATAAPSEGPAASIPPGAVTIVAKDIAFTPSEVTVPADEPVTIVMDNQEDAPHNIYVKDSTGADVFKGEIVSKQQITYDHRPTRSRDVPVHLRGPPEHDRDDHRRIARVGHARFAAPLDPGSAARTRGLRMSGGHRSRAA